MKTIEQQNMPINFNSSKKKQWAKERKPFSAFFELTSRCNMNCIHCYLQDHHDTEDLSYAEVIKIIDILYEHGILFLTFSGGEIFTRNDFKEIYLYAKHKGFLIELFSNGLAIDKEIIEVFKKYPPLLVDISLYGACEETYRTVTGVRGAFLRVVDNCKKLIGAGIRVSLKTPVLRETCCEIEDMRDLANSLNVPFCVTYEINATIDRDNKTKGHQLPMADMLRYEFLDHERNDQDTLESEEINLYKVNTDSVFLCNVAQCSFIIDYQGRMCPCMKFRHRGIKLTKENFDSIWNEFGKLQHIKATPEYKCKSCIARYYCDECPAEREFLYGELETVNPHTCKYAHARYVYYREKMSIDEAIAFSINSTKGGVEDEL